MWDKGLLYEGHKVMPYCPRCGTALSSHEVAQGYKDVKDLTCIAKFKIINEVSKENKSTPLIVYISLSCIGIIALLGILIYRKRR